jgi:type VI secretion system secreted protein Hcp
MAIFLKYPAVDGEVQVTGHEKWIDIQSLSLGLGRGIASAQAGSGSERESSAASVSEITITKTTDGSSMKLMQEALVGELDNEVEIHLTRTDKAQGQQTYLSYKLTNCGISGYSLSTGGDRPSESLTLNFTKIESKYYLIGDNLSGNPEAFTYDLQKATIV